MFEQDARTAAATGQVYGSATDADALAQIQAAGAGTVDRVLFVGHGVRTDGYIFARGADSTAGAFGADDAALMQALDGALLRQRNAIPSIEFHCCNLVGSPLVAALQTVLSTSRFTGGYVVNIKAYRYRLLFRPVLQNGRIIGWYNQEVGPNSRIDAGSPASAEHFTIIPAGRNPAIR